MNPAAERHYRVRELASLWGFSPKTVVRLFASEPGVIQLTSGTGKRKYVTLSIPESVALRVHQRLTRAASEAQLPSSPVRILRLRELSGATGKRPRTILNLRAG